MAPETFFLFEGAVTTTVTCSLMALAEDVANGSSENPGTDQPPHCTAGNPGCDVNTIRITSGFLWVSGPPQPDAKESPIYGGTAVVGETKRLATITNFTPDRPLKEIKAGVEVTNCTSSNDACPNPGSSTANANVRLTVTVTSSTCNISVNTGTVTISKDTHHMKIIRDIGPPDFVAALLAPCSVPITVTADLTVGQSNPVEIEPGNSSETGWGTLVARSCAAPVLSPSMCSGT